MKIGDEVFVHGYVDEIRKDCVIIRNDGGYFGTAKEEVVIRPTDRLQGEWIYMYNPFKLDEWVCNRCGNISVVRTNFCDQCGAHMKRGNDE